MIGQRLKIARAAASVSLRELSARIGNLVTAQAIGKYERDEAMPGSRVLIALTAALGVSEDYLLGDQEMVLEGVEFRKKAITSRSEEAKVEAQTLHLLERYLLIESVLDLSSLDWDKPQMAPFPVHEVSQAEQAARSLREHWGLGIDPIPNLAELLEERGIKVLAVDLANVDGLMALVRRPGSRVAPVVVVNRRARGERQRFTLSHELGHLVMRVDDKLNAEKVAQRFAGAFLMPAEALWAAIGTHRNSIGWSELFQLKELLRVSVQAIAYRCKDLGIFSDALTRRLFQEFSRRGWRRPPYDEPHPLVAEEPHRFDRLVYRALAEHAISEPKAAELLGISLHELNRRMEEPVSAALSD